MVVASTASTHTGQLVFVVIEQHFRSVVVGLIYHLLLLLSVSTTTVHMLLIVRHRLVAHHLTQDHAVDNEALVLVVGDVVPVPG